MKRAGHRATSNCTCVMYMYVCVCVCVCVCVYSIHIGEEMAPHSSILAWRIPWVEEPGGLQSTGSQRVGHD